MALKDWTFSSHDGKYKWVYSDRATEKDLVLPEDELGGVELELLRATPAARSFLEKQEYRD